MIGLADRFEAWARLFQPPAGTPRAAPRAGPEASRDQARSPDAEQRARTAAERDAGDRTRLRVHGRTLQRR